MYIKFVELESPMLHAKFQDFSTSGSGEDFKGFYQTWSWGHLGHVTWTSYINFFPLP